MKRKGLDHWIAYDPAHPEDTISYRRRLGRCKVCGRTLTKKQSVQFGIGPVCITRYPELANAITEDDADEVLRAEFAKLDDLVDEEGEEEILTTTLTIPLPAPTLPNPYDEAKSHLSHYAPHSFREYQQEAIEFIVNSVKRFVFLEAPTGSGKSVVAIVASWMIGGVTYAVHSKVLQAQITSDFPEAKSLFGRSNYPCIVNPSLTCDECTHKADDPCESKESCIYEVQKSLVKKSKLRILNYDYLLTAANYAGSFTGSAFNIIDEADNLENTLINFVALTFTDYHLTRLGIADHAETLKQTSKFKDELLSSWITFATAAKKSCVAIVCNLERKVDGMSKPYSTSDIKIMKDLTRMKRLLEKINLFLNNVDATWLLDTSDNKYAFRPLWMTPDLAEMFLWKHAKRWVLMSASFLPIHLEAKRLGIDMIEVDYKCLPSTFSVNRRPIHVEAAASLTSKTMETETPKLIKRIKEIMEIHPDSKGLIHAVSYKLSNAILLGVNSVRFLTHDSKNRQSVLTEFMQSAYPYVLISPSMDRGVSLEMDLCRFIIVAKAPFLYLGDKIVSARVYSGQMGKDWYAATMLTTVLQMTGRGMRSADDECLSYILDEQFKRVFEQKPRFLPDWWKDAVV